MTEANATSAAKAAGRKGQGRKQRSAARLAAAQALYQVEIANAPVEQVLKEFLDHRLGESIDGVLLVEADRDLLCDLVRGVSAQPDAFDDMLAAVLDADWTVERLETLLRVVLRIGAYEMSDRRDVPARVIISEYLDLADAFFGGKEPGLVNGVLDRLAHELRPEEFTASDQPG